MYTVEKIAGKIKGIIKMLGIWGVIAPVVTIIGLGISVSKNSPYMHLTKWREQLPGNHWLNSQDPFDSLVNVSNELMHSQILALDSLTATIDKSIDIMNGMAASEITSLSPELDALMTAQDIYSSSVQFLFPDVKYYAIDAVTKKKLKKIKIAPKELIEIQYVGESDGVQQQMNLSIKKEDFQGVKDGDFTKLKDFAASYIEDPKITKISDGHIIGKQSGKTNLILFVNNQVKKVPIIVK
jgi:hypothetical protein